MENNITRVGGASGVAGGDKPKFHVDSVRSFIYYNNRFKQCELAHVKHPELNYQYVKHQAYFPDRATGEWRESGFSLMPLTAWPDYVKQIESFNDYMVQVAAREGLILQKFKIVFDTTADTAATASNSSMYMMS